MCRSNCLVDPAWQKGYDIWHAYYLGDRVYATPVVAPGGVVDVVLPAGRWYCGRTAALVESDGNDSVRFIASLGDPPPHFIRAGKLLVKQPYVRRAHRTPKTLIVEIYADHEIDDVYELYEDDGLTREGGFAWTRFKVRGTDSRIDLEIGPADGTFSTQPEARHYEIRLVRQGQSRTVTTPMLSVGEAHRMAIE